MAFEEVALALSLASIGIASFTAWATLLRRGAVRMTRPAVIYFGPDGGHERKRKVYLRALLYTTGNRGHIVEGMFARLQRGEATQAFNIWVYGGERLTRGSGLRIGPEGVATDHHFLLPEDAVSYEFTPGKYRVEVFAQVVGERRPRSLLVCDLDLTAEQADAIRGGKSGVYYDWSPNAERYHPSVRTARLRSEEVDELVLETIFQPRVLG